MKEEGERKEDPFFHKSQRRNGSGSGYFGVGESGSRTHTKPDFTSLYLLRSVVSCRCDMEKVRRVVDVNVLQESAGGKRIVYFVKYCCNTMM